MIEFVAAAAALTALAGASLAMYLLPLIVGMLRRVPDIGSVAVINVLLGWTLVGWAAAMALALRSARTDRPAVQIVQHLPPGRPLPALPPAGGWAGHPGGPVPRQGPPPLVLPPRPAGSWHPPGFQDPDGFENAAGSWGSAGVGESEGYGEPEGFGEPDGSWDRGVFQPEGQWNPGGFQDPAGDCHADGPWEPGGSSDPRGAGDR